MKKIVIHGGRPLKGEVTINGAKNSVVALIPAVILADDIVTLDGVPDISDVDSLIDIMIAMGASVTRSEDSLTIDPRGIQNVPMPYGKINSLRASYYFYGSLLGRYGEATVGLPGGCDLGPRPIDLHLKAFEAMGTLLSNVEPSTVANANKQSFTKNQQLILDNKALFMPNGTWVVGEMAKAPRAEGFKWAMTAAPAIEKGGKRYVYSFFEHIWVPKESKNQAAAKEFLSFLYSDKAAEIFAKYNAAQPIQGVTAKLPEELKALYKVVDEVDGVINGNFVATKPVEGVSMKDTLYGQIDSVASGQKTIAEWQKSVEEVSQKLKAAVQ